MTGVQTCALPIFVRVAGKAMALRALQCAKAWGMMVAREAGSVTSRSEVLCANATALMVLRVSGSVSFVSEVQHAYEENDPYGRPQQ